MITPRSVRRPASIWRILGRIVCLFSLGAATAFARPVVVASKPFAESFLLAEMFAQVLEARGFEVDRRLGLGATEIAFGALREGAIDVYPEYTGTGLVAILQEPPQADPREVYRTVVDLPSGGPLAALIVSAQDRLARAGTCA